MTENYVLITVPGRPATLVLLPPDAGQHEDHLSAKNDGTSSQDEFVKRMEAQPKTKVFRNRDKKDLMGLNRGRKVGTFPLPADFTVARQGELFYAEVKSTSSTTSFPYGNIEPGQRSAAIMCAACGAPYWFFIQRMSDGAWFQLSGTQFASDIKAGKKSRKFEELEHCTLM